MVSDYCRTVSVIMEKHAWPIYINLYVYYSGMYNIKTIMLMTIGIEMTIYSNGPIMHNFCYGI